MRGLTLLFLALLVLISGCVHYDYCETWLIDPHFLNPSAPSKSVNVPSCQTGQVP